MSTYFLMCPGYYAIGTSPAQCWKYMRAHSARTRTEIRKGEYFMLEFAEAPADACIEVNPVDGKWASRAYPVRVVEHNKLSPKRLHQFTKWCAEGMRRQLERHANKLGR